MSRNVCENVERPLPPLQSPPAANEVPMTSQLAQNGCVTIAAQQPACFAAQTNISNRNSQTLNLAVVSMASSTS